MAEAASAARAVGLVAQAAEFHRGSRVEDYAPLCALATRLCASLASLPAAAAASGGAGGDPAPGAAEAGAAKPACPSGASLCDDGASLDGAPSLSCATLRLIAAIVAGHGKGVGASAGLSALEGAAVAWAPALTAAHVHQALALARSLIRPPGGGAAAAALFAAELLGAGARAVLGAEDEGCGEGSAGLAAGLPAARALRAEGLALLVEACGVLQPVVHTPWVPFGQSVDAMNHRGRMLHDCVKCSCRAWSGLPSCNLQGTVTPVLFQ